MTSTGARRGVAQAIVWGGLTVGVLDIVEPIVFYGLRGVAPIRILQSIASGLLGPSAYQGGVPTAALGLVLHFFIAFVAAAVYFGASLRLPALVRRPLVWGPDTSIRVIRGPCRIDTSPSARNPLDCPA